MEKKQFVNALEEYSNLAEKELLRCIQINEKKISNQNIRYFCPNHNLEIYLFEYYLCRDEYQILDIPLHKMYEALTKKQIKDQRYVEAMKSIANAKIFNPVDIEIMETEAYLYRCIGDFDKLSGVVNQLYKFCYTRRDIALYYRLAACCHIEKYQPGIARVLLLYSYLFYAHPSVEHDLNFLSAALEEDTPNYSTNELINKLHEYNYPIQAKEDTLAILYRVVNIEKNNGNTDYAKMLMQYLLQQ